MRECESKRKRAARADTEPLFTSAIHHRGERHRFIARCRLCGLLRRPTTAKLVPRLCSHTKKCHDALEPQAAHALADNGERMCCGKENGATR